LQEGRIKGLPKLIRLISDLGAIEWEVGRFDQVVEDSGSICRDGDFDLMVVDK
jgi:hypothetical protein